MDVIGKEFNFILLPEFDVKCISIGKEVSNLKICKSNEFNWKKDTCTLNS